MKLKYNIKKIIEFLGEIEKPKQPQRMTLDIVINLSAPKKKRKVTVFNNFVKVGFDQYRIKRDFFTDDEYAIIDGKRYEIYRNPWTGRGYLVEI